MENRRSQLNPNAAEFVPYAQQSRQDIDKYPGGEISVLHRASDHEQFAPGELAQMTNDFLEFLEENPPEERAGHPIRAHDRDSHDSSLNCLMMRFPGYAKDSIAEVYQASGGDIEAAMDMLTQLESFNVTDLLPDTLDIGHTSFSAPPESEPSSSISESSVIDCLPAPTNDRPVNRKL